MTQAFNLSQLANNVNTSGQLNAAAGLYNQTVVANGGTGVATVASGAILVGAGTSAMTAVPATTANNVLTANGTAWVSAASAGGPAPVVTIYTSPSPWTKPATVKAVRVIVFAAGGNGGSTTGGVGGSGNAGGGSGGAAQGVFLAASIPGPVVVTVGGAGSASPASFGAFISATAGGTPPSRAHGSGGISPGGAGGAGSGGNILNYYGITAVNNPNPTSAPYSAGAGASTILNTQQPGQAAGQFLPGPGSLAGNPNASIGGGGGGAVSANPGGGATGGSGGGGRIVIEELY